ncbi:hypothetical protein QYE76_037629 [Lolium multiflorum]|uniref:Uncharacterized protein n=1 Tax=Lolium multiflorum TaxID=4521 RepID=A0AAD8QFP7_LOLMU|nr:hypothetical protein QYE76_037629 [Lolium multiflorum]
MGRAWANIFGPTVGPGPRFFPSGLGRPDPARERHRYTPRSPSTMVKKKNLTLAANTTASGAAAKASSSALKKGASHASVSVPPAPEVPTAGPAPGDWPASTTSKRDEKKARSLGIISDDEGNVILREFHAEENANLEDEDSDPMNPEAFSIDPKSFADDMSDTAESNHDDDADRAAFVNAAEEANVLPLNRLSESFFDEDDLDLDDVFIELPLKKTKPSSDKPAPAASEASAPAIAPTAQVSTASSLSKAKELPSTAVVAASPPEKPPFVSQFSSLEADKARLQKEVESTSSNLENAIKMAAEARQNADSLTEELDKLKTKLKDKEASKLAAEAEKNEKDGLLRQSALALLKGADISADTLGKLPDDSPVDVLTLVLESNKLIQDLLEKNKGIMLRLHSMIFPKADQNKTLGQLTDCFVVDTKGTIEVLKRTSRTYGALLAFHLMMGHGFQADMELMSKELPKE